MNNYQEALAAVKAELKGVKYRVLENYHKNKFGFNAELELWEVTTKIILPNGNMMDIRLWVEFPKEYPVSFPKVLVSKQDYPKFEYGPHVESDGKICLFSNTAQPNIEDPVRVLKEAINRTHTILEETLEDVAAEVYEDEFESYWSQTYGKKDQVEHKYLIVAEKPLDTKAQVLVLDSNLPGFRRVIYQDDTLIRPFKEMLKRQRITFEQYPLFIFGELPFFTKPPFHLNNHQLQNQLKEFDLALYQRFISFYNQNPNSRFFIFQKVIKGTTRYFGWRHEPLKGVRGFKVSNINQDFERLVKIQPSKPIIRIYPQVYSNSRLIERSVGLPMPDAPTYTIAGLGSIGSHLIHFLDGPGIHFHLIDTDFLSLENIARHLLGFQYIGQQKTVALQDYLTLRYPLRSVDIRKDSVLQLLQKEPEFIESTDVIFISIGEHNKELLIAKALQDQVLTKPIFILWVEPYGMAGHCIYLDPKKPDFQRYHTDGAFDHSIIADFTHEALAKQEAGCQSIYTPYAPNSVQFFLGALVPHITQILKDPSSFDTHVFSWIGDLTIAEDFGIPIKPEAANFIFGETRII